MSLSCVQTIRRGTTSNEANKYLAKNGVFWLKESFDRFIRNEEHFTNEIKYIENNPVKAWG